MQTRSAMTCLFYGRCRSEFVLGQLSRGPRSPVIQHEDVLAKQFQILHDDLALALALAEEVANSRIRVSLCRKCYQLAVDEHHLETFIRHFPSPRAHGEV